MDFVYVVVIFQIARCDSNQTSKAFLGDIKRWCGANEYSLLCTHRFFHVVSQQLYTATPQGSVATAVVAQASDRHGGLLDGKFVRAGALKRAAQELDEDRVWGDQRRKRHHPKHNDSNSEEQLLQEKPEGSELTFNARLAFRCSFIAEYPRSCPSSSSSAIATATDGVGDGNAFSQGAASMLDEGSISVEGVVQLHRGLFG